jgi:uncharacterized protein YbjT (DUF2867 family)
MPSILNKVCLIGATGLTGSFLLDELISDNRIGEIILLVRKPLSISNPKVKIFIIDFTNEDEYNQGIKNCDCVFVCVGTTMKKVKGNKEEYKKIDFDIPRFVAKASKKENVNAFVLMSSVNANTNAGNFYFKLKGETEDAVSNFKIPSLYILRPSMLLGSRKENRPMEKFGQLLMQSLSFLIPSNSKPVYARQVAIAMKQAAIKSQIGSHIWHYNEIISSQ